MIARGGQASRPAACRLPDEPPTAPVLPQSRTENVPGTGLPCLHRTCADLHPPTWVCSFLTPSDEAPPLRRARRHSFSSDSEHEAD